MTIHQQFEESTADIEDVMSLPPMSAADHAAMQRCKVATRRFIEDAREDARARREDSFADC